MTSGATPSLIFDFGDPAAAAAWTAIDDRVMGGVSQSRLRPDPAGFARFEGLVSLERNGGFASVRSSPGEHGGPGAAAVWMEVRGDGRRYKLNLLADARFDGVQYQAGFLPDAMGDLGTWQHLQIPLSAFRPSFRGREVPGAPTLDPARIRQLGLMIADRQAGPFALAVRRIGWA